MEKVIFGKAFKETPMSRAAIGITPCRFLKARLKASGDSYPYFIATSTTLILLVCKSKAANVNRLRLIYSDNGMPVKNENIL